MGHESSPGAARHRLRKAVLPLPRGGGVFIKGMERKGKGKGPQPTAESAWVSASEPAIRRTNKNESIDASFRRNGLLKVFSGNDC